MMADVAFLGGFGRSGSTLFERMIAAVPGVFALGEVRHLWARGVRDNEPCACGKPFDACPFWTTVGQRAFGGWDRVDVDRIAYLVREVDRTRHIPSAVLASSSSGHATLAREYAEYFRSVYRAATEVSGAAIVVDSSKDASTAYALRLHPGISMRIVHVVRDSRAVAYSWSKSVVRPEASQSSPQQMMDRYPPWLAALLWMAHNAAFDTLARGQMPVHRVRYEDVMARPEQMLQDTARFLGLDPASVASVLKGNVIRVGPSHQAAGNPMRFHSGELTLRRDDAWRTKFPAVQRRIVSALTAPVLYRYGYIGQSRQFQPPLRSSRQ